MIGPTQSSINISYQEYGYVLKVLMKEAFEYTAMAIAIAYRVPAAHVLTLLHHGYYSGSLKKSIGVVCLLVV